MVRYAKQHKVETRQRIIASAGRRLKTDGIDGSGVATLMKDAGLTNGAFYAHFDSKDDLVATVIVDQLHELDAKLVAQADPGAAGLEQMVRWYLSPEHRDDTAEGCPNAALLDEIPRCDEATRQAYTDGLLVVIEGLAARVDPRDPGSARVRALSLLGMMAGTLQFARAVTDRSLSDELLEQGIRNALSLLDAWRRA
jgi:TetR/AcrR family transcriptional repressor of nem operon